MRVYCVEYVLAGDSKIHRIHVHAPSVKDVLDKLADRFGNGLQEFEIQFADQSDLLASNGRLAAAVLGDVVLISGPRLLQTSFSSVLLSTEQLVVRAGGRSG